MKPIWDSENYTVSDFPADSPLHLMALTRLSTTRPYPLLVDDPVDAPMPHAKLTLQFPDPGTARLYQDFFADKWGDRPRIEDSAIHIAVYDFEGIFTALQVLKDNFAATGWGDTDTAHAMAWMKAQASIHYRNPPVRDTVSSESPGENALRLGAGLEEDRSAIEDSLGARLNKIRDFRNIVVPFAMRAQIDQVKLGLGPDLT